MADWEKGAKEAWQLAEDIITQREKKKRRKVLEDARCKSLPRVSAPEGCRQKS